MLRHALMACAVAGLAGATPAAGQAESPYLGQMMLVPYTFCPIGWAEANGQLLAISANSALYSLLGTTYGGDGRTTFALPDPRGRSIIHTGTSSTGRTFELGERSGTTSVTLLSMNLPAHSHTVYASNQPTTNDNPTGNLLGDFPTGLNVYIDGPANSVMSLQMIGVSGQNAPVDIQNPYLTMRWCIAMEGVYPSRN